MGYYPFFIDLKNKKCVVIGGGNVAYRKIRVLLDFGADVKVVSKKFDEKILAFGENIEIVEKDFEKTDISKAFCVVSTTNNKEVNTQVSEICKKENILVNIADSIEECSFIFPAIAKDEDVIIGVSTSGKSPLMSRVIRDYIAETLPKKYSVLTAKLGIIREILKNQVSSEKKRRNILKKLSEIGLENNGELTSEIVNEIIKGGKNE